MADLRLGSLVAEVDGPGHNRGGPPVLLVHGLGGSSTSFQPLMAALAGRQAIRPDLPGAGRSAPRPGRPGLAGLAAALRDLLRACGIARATLVGHSMGSLLCQYLAAADPGLVAGLVLFGPILEPPPPARDALRERAATARRDGMAGIADAVSSGSLSAATRDGNPATVAFVRESVLGQPPAGYAAHCLALAEAQAADHGRIACPTLLVAGAEDPVAPPAMAQRLQAAIAGAQLEVLPRCGHWPMMERPNESARLLAAALEQIHESSRAEA